MDKTLEHQFETEDVVLYNGELYTLGRRCGQKFHGYKIVETPELDIIYHLDPKDLMPFSGETLQDGQTIEI